MAPATEIVYITLKAGVDLEVSTPEAQAWQESLATIAAQDGYQRSYYGRQLEDPNILILVIDWDSKDSHTKFINSPGYGPFKSKLGSIMESVHLHHITPTPFPPKILGLGTIIEFATFFNVESTFTQNVEKFVTAIDQGKPEGYVGFSWGPVLEPIVKHADIGKMGVSEGPATVLLIGWASKELHLKFRDTDLFQSIIGLLREKNSGAELFHVPFKAVTSVV